MPISISSCDKEHVKCISWAQIIDWLNECICQIDTIRKIPITEILMQYKTTIENFLKGGNNTMDNENIIEMIIKDEKNFESAEKIAENMGSAKQKIWTKLKNEIIENIKQKNFDENKLVIKYPEKIAYQKSEPDSSNIAQYNVITYESGAIQTNQIRYQKDADNIHYKEENRNQRKTIEFVDIVDNNKFEEKVKECVSFLLD